VTNDNLQPVSILENRKARRRSNSDNSRLPIVSFHIPPNLLKAVDELVERGVFTSRSEAFRTAIVLMLRDYAKLKHPAPQPEVGYR
jgi:metal-responsive CopG/Arc/MetJ family transcriptional regulator